MATSGSFQTNSYYNRSIQFDWWINGAQDIVNNKTNIGWQLKGSGTASGYIVSGNFKVDAGGAIRYSSATRINLYQNTVIASGSFDVYHNSTGEGSFGAYAEAGIYQIAVNCTGSSSWVLPTIPRYANFTEHYSSAKTISTITVQWNTDAVCDALQYSLNGGAWTGIGYSTTYTLTGLSPNTAYTIRTRVKRTDSQLWTESTTISTTTFNYATYTGLSNINIGDNIPVQISNPSGAEVHLWIRNLSDTIYALSDYVIVNGANTIITNSTINNLLYSMTPNSNILTVRYVIRTRQNGAEYWVVEDKLMYVVNSNPTFGNFTYKDTNAITLALTGNDSANVNNKFIAKYSNIEVKIPSANKMTTINSATPVKYVSTLTTDKDIVYGTGDVATTYNNANSSQIKVVAKDSRSNESIPVIKDIINLSYAECIINNMRFDRKGGVGTAVLVVGNGTYDTINFGAVANTVIAIDYKIRTKIGSFGDWISIKSYFTIATGTFTNKVLNELVSTNCVLGTEYVVEVRAVDNLSTYTSSFNINSGKVLSSKVKGQGVCFGGIYDTAVGGALQVKGEEVVIKGSVDGLDMNNVTETGFYRGYNMTNSANMLISTFEVIKYSPDWITQIQYTVEAVPKTYIRSRHSGTTWGDWINQALHSYPIGSVYQNATSSTSPATLFGGTWVALYDRMLIGAGNTYAVNATGGTTTETLTVAQLPKHRPSFLSGNKTQSYYDEGVSDTSFAPKYQTILGYNLGQTDFDIIGNDQAHNNMSSWRGVYQWYRSA